MSTLGAAVDLMVEDRFKVAVIPRLNAMPIILLINELVKAITQVAMSLKTRIWGGLHGCKPLVLEESEMRLVANDPTLTCDRMKKPLFTHPDITPLKTVTEDKQFTNDNKVTWDKYYLQEAVIFHGRAAIVAAVMLQYIEEKEVNHLGYSMESIITLIAHLQTWPLITNASRMATKASFVAPWSNSPDQHLSAYARDLTRRQNNATKYAVKITNDDKVMQLFVCIYEADILEDSVMEKWEESGDRSCTTTMKHFMKDYGVVTRAAEQAAQRAGYESAAAFREYDRPPLENAPHTAVPRPSMEDYDAMTAYVKALEQANQELRSVGGRSSETTSLSETHEDAASAIATNTATEMMEEMQREQKETAAKMKQLTAMLLAATTNKSPKTPFSATTPLKPDGVFYNPLATRRVRHPPPKNVQTSGLLRGKPIRTCASCTKNWVTHSDNECYELEANASKRRPGWINYFL